MAPRLPSGIAGPALGSFVGGGERAAKWIYVPQGGGARVELYETSPWKVVTELQKALNITPTGVWDVGTMQALNALLVNYQLSDFGTVPTTNGAPLSRELLRAIVWLLFVQPRTDVPRATPDEVVWLPNSLTLPRVGESTRETGIGQIFKTPLTPQTNPSRPAATTSTSTTPSAPVRTTPSTPTAPTRTEAGFWSGTPAKVLLVVAALGVVGLGGKALFERYEDRKVASGAWAPRPTRGRYERRDMLPAPDGMADLERIAARNRARQKGRGR